MGTRRREKPRLRVRCRSSCTNTGSCLEPRPGRLSPLQSTPLNRRNCVSATKPGTSSTEGLLNSLVCRVGGPSTWGWPVGNRQPISVSPREAKAFSGWPGGRARGSTPPCEAAVSGARPGQETMQLLGCSAEGSRSRRRGSVGVLPIRLSCSSR